MKTKTKKSPIFSLLLFLSLLLTAACSSDDEDFSLEGDNFSISDIAGSWIATSAVFDIAGTGPSQRIDVVEEGGTVTLVIQNNGRFTLTVTQVGEAPEVTTGRLGFDEDLLVVSYDDDPDEFEFFGSQFSGNNLSIQGPAEFDFDGDGTDDPARVSLDLVRN